MEDLLAEDEDRLVSGTTVGLNSGPESCISNKGITQAENPSEMLSREFSKMYLKDKHRKSKRHCTRYIIRNELQTINYNLYDFYNIAPNGVA